MKAPRTRQEKDEYERRGDEIYDRVVAPRLKEEDLGKFVLMDNYFWVPLPPKLPGQEANPADAVAYKMVPFAAPDGRTYHTTARIEWINNVLYSGTDLYLRKPITRPLTLGATASASGRRSTPGTGRPGYSARIRAGPTTPSRAIGCRRPTVGGLPHAGRGGTRRSPSWSTSTPRRTSGSS